MPNSTHGKHYSSVLGSGIQLVFTLLLLSLLVLVMKIIILSGNIISQKPDLILDRFYDIVLNSTMSIVMRLLLFFKNLPLFLSFIILAVMDGLVMRDIRKFQAARESALWFHRVKVTLIYFFYSGFLFYLSVPDEIDLESVLICIMLSVSILIQVLVKGYKKYV